MFAVGGGGAKIIVTPLRATWRNFLSPESGTMFRREVGLPLFLEVANFLKTQRTVVRKLNVFSRFDGTLTCDRQIDRQTQCLCVVPRASMASRG